MSAVAFTHADAPSPADGGDVRALPSWRRRLRRRARLIAGLGIIALFYLVALSSDLIAPYDYRAQARNEPAAPPTPVRFRDADGNWHARPFIYARRLADPLARTYVEDTTRAYPLTLCPHGYSYHLFGLIPTDRHLFGVQSTPQTTQAANAQATSGQAARAADTAAMPPRLYLLGADASGRDYFSRLLRATRFSLLVGPVGTLLAALLGILIGCVAGYAGHTVDAVLMRAADAMLALPELLLILAARAAFPIKLEATTAALLLVGIFIAIGWAEMARVTRGLVLALRQREFVLAATGLGLSETRILFRHILPNAARTLVVQVSLLLPAFLLAETALSYLGVGVQEPEASWGNMLAAASDLNLLAAHPFIILTPAIAIFIFVLSVRLTSDGLRRPNR
ncbi:MAG TPA: ABC transporter permease [Pyrinomonadaceae bacterium]|nr:ABC transporter permease [Pyrinomonadaceae bacterium]